MIGNVADHQTGGVSLPAVPARARVGVRVIAQGLHCAGHRHNASLAFGESLITRETVATETPASRATSFYGRHDNTYSG